MTTMTEKQAKDMHRKLTKKLQITKNMVFVFKNLIVLPTDVSTMFNEMLFFFLPI